MQPQSHPRVLINIILMNSLETKILFVKKMNKRYWELLGHVLDYGDSFEKCVKDIMKNETTMKLGEKDNERIKYICSYNAVDKENERHFVEINYAIKINEEKDGKVEVDTNKYWSWKWMTMEDIKKSKSQLFYGFQIFLQKFNINLIKDIMKIDSI